MSSSVRSGLFAGASSIELIVAPRLESEEQELQALCVLTVARESGSGSSAPRLKGDHEGAGRS